ncbi:hypothetical protein [Geobacillus stearothermophilus]|uniref:hypothetical protein n=2 Tax=Geobacillus stearothermophilus TaxID=1422 RepID=UPI000655F476|nr:hypothetical protein [Geobacillus stearothermophilus]AKM19261.1 hypothetical protein GARCT_01998 [Geobacillus sp. 12AMOR1]MDF9297624.1 hypothetical protein [Geobacillus stearothermophilus]STO12432.1 Uncharacterised protein [[Flavobacterium] thermophilum]
MNRFTIPRDIYFGENALDVLKTLEGTKVALVMAAAPSRKTEILIKFRKFFQQAM